jgi:lipoprotein-anchoring transpeptidase ErfK/SrfK
MKQLAFALAAVGLCALGHPGSPPAAAAMETFEAKSIAGEAVAQARFDMLEAFGAKILKPGQYVWRDVPKAAGPERVVVSLSDQLAFVYRGNTLMAVATISSGKAPKNTPTGIFSVLDKKPMYRSRKYDNAPMPFMQRIDQYGIALHAGYNPGEPASHGCVRLPSKFAAKLYSMTDIGTPVLIGI